MTGLQHVSLFSGVGGIDLAMHHAGIPTRLACEYDKAARGVLADRYPNTVLHDDVRTLTGDHLRALNLDPARTVASAGFPCQDLSVAGARRGMGHGTRSGLYWEVDRLLGDFAPAWVVLENVPGLLSATCACPGDGTCVARALAVRCDGETHAVPGGACWGECIARHGGVMGAVLGSLAERGYGFAYRVLDARHFGVPQRRRRVVIVGRLGDDGRAPARVLLEPEGLPGHPAPRVTPRPHTPTRVGGRAQVRSVLGTHTHALTAEGHDASEDGTGRGTPIVAFALRGRDDGAVPEVHDDGSTVGALRSAGGGSSRDYVIAPHTAATLTAGVASKPGVNAPGRRQEDDHNIVAYEAAAGQLVRRLTPTECERLQGFPDGHTATSWGRPQADSPRYKQMGNAVAVPVFAWVAHRLAAIDAEPCGDLCPFRGCPTCTHQGGTDRPRKEN